MIYNRIPMRVQLFTVGIQREYGENAFTIFIGLNDAGIRYEYYCLRQNYDIETIVYSRVPVIHISP